MLKIAEALQQAATQLRNSDVPNDLRDAQTLLAFALNQDRTYLIINFNEILPDELLEKYQLLIDRRATGEPLQYIIGSQEFYGLEFEVTPSVLIPRPETELIIEETIHLAETRNSPVIIDVGTGSGCIAVTLARELESAEIVATDISPEALKVARRNAEKYRLSSRIQFIETDLLAAMDRNLQVDFIVSNPPYISEAEMASLQREVRDWEPKIALTDFSDGLQFYRRLLHDSPAYLKSGGFLIFEIGFGQGAEIGKLVDEPVWADCKILKDLQGIERTFVLTCR